MITNIAVTGVFVSDEDKALDFYVNKLGFEKRADEPMGDGMRWIEVAPPGAVTRIVAVARDGGVGRGQSRPVHRHRLRAR